MAQVIMPASVPATSKPADPSQDYISHDPSAPDNMAAHLSLPASDVYKRESPQSHSWASLSVTVLVAMDQRKAWTGLEWLWTVSGLFLF